MIICDGFKSPQLHEVLKHINVKDKLLNTYVIT